MFRSGNFTNIHLVTLIFNHDIAHNLRTATSKVDKFILYYYDIFIYSSFIIFNTVILKLRIIVIFKVNFFVLDERPGALNSLSESVSLSALILLFKEIFFKM